MKALARHCKLFRRMDLYTQRSVYVQEFDQQRKLVAEFTIHLGAHQTLFFDGYQFIYCKAFAGPVSNY